MGRVTIGFALGAALLSASALLDTPATASELPPLLARVAPSDAGRLVAVVAADVDADGDLDVIGTDAALQLHVWINDGAGHFTRRNPIPSNAWGSVPGAPSVDHQSVAPQTFTRIAPPSFAADCRCTGCALAPGATAAVVRIAAESAVDGSTRTPRAPPVSAH